MGLGVFVFVCVFAQLIVEAKQVSTKSAKIVIHHPDKTGALMARWQWALAEAERQKFSQGFWIGYSIEREMSEGCNMIMGEVWINDSQVIVRGIPLIDLLESKEPERLQPTKILIQNKNGKQLVTKQIAVLFQFSGSPSSSLKKIGMSDLPMPVSLRNKPLLWLGAAEINSSLEHIRNLYRDHSDQDFECSLANIIEVHGLLDK
jgi:hypothetical protein